MSDLHGLGKEGEAHAWSVLKKRGDKLVARNFTCPVGELDLITWHGQTLVFTEVRARSATQHGTPAETVTQTKQRRVRRAAEWYLSRSFKQNLPSCRFDVVWIVYLDGVVREYLNLVKRSAVDAG